MKLSRYGNIESFVAAIIREIRPEYNLHIKYMGLYQTVSFDVHNELDELIAYSYWKVSDLEKLTIADVKTKIIDELDNMLAIRAEFL